MPGVTYEGLLYILVSVIPLKSVEWLHGAMQKHQQTNLSRLEYVNSFNHHNVSLSFIETTEWLQV